MKRLIALEKQLTHFADANVQLWTARHGASGQSARQILRRLQAGLGRRPPLRSSFADPAISLTHAGNRIYAMAVRQSPYCGVGLDFEPWRAMDMRHRSLLLTRRERATANVERSQELLRIWTVKESLYKADRHGQQRWISAYELVQPSSTRGAARVRANQRTTRFRYVSIEVTGGILSAAFALREQQGKGS